MICNSLYLSLLGEEFQKVWLTEAVAGGGEVGLLLVVDGGRHLLTVGLAGAEAVVLADDLQVVFVVLTAHQVVLNLANIRELSSYHFDDNILLPCYNW